MRFIVLMLMCLAGATGVAHAEISLFKADALITAVKNDDADAVAKLVARGHSPNVVDGRSRTPLILAAVAGNDEIVEVLVKLQAKLDRRDTLGNTALLYAAESNHVGVVEILLAQGANPNIENRRGITPLIAAAGAGHVAAAALLMDRKADSSSTDFTGRTALMWAKRNNRHEMVQLLSRRGVAN